MAIVTKKENKGKIKLLQLNRNRYETFQWEYLFWGQLATWGILLNGHALQHRHYSALTEMVRAPILVSCCGTLAAHSFCTLMHSIPCKWALTFHYSIQSCKNGFRYTYPLSNLEMTRNKKRLIYRS